MRPIDADAIKEDIDKSIFDADDKEWYLTLLANAPTIEPKRGEWKLFYESKDGDNVYKCSCCRFLTVIPEGIKLFSFCPNCGATMKGADDEADND